MIPVREAKMFTGVFLFVWVIPYGIAMLALAALYARFLWRLPSTTRSMFFLAAATFLAGAVGLEMVGGVVYERGNYERAIPIDVCNGLEESLEMLGVVIFLFALTGYLADQFGNLHVSFAREVNAEESAQD
ncbi:MAG: hypothetical protein O2931_13765 [Planctomycetota bacterium]|nr:hypothetical protein [Planctomycetota bacterium]MDA1179852.1 hypothetical protein [Planctomycetota bacterium]